MSKTWFDKTCDPKSWFDVTTKPGGWFSIESIADNIALPTKVYWVQLEIPYGAPLSQARAVYWNGNQIAEVTDALIGTGLKPLVLLNGEVKERAASEGDAIVLIEGVLCVLPSGYELLI